MFTGKELADFALKVHDAKWAYWYGTCGHKCSQDLYQRKKAQYPSHYTATRESIYKADIKAGRMCADCVGLIKSFFWLGAKLDGTNRYSSNGCPDVSADGMYKLCRETGAISSIPDVSGLIVWKTGHIGVYVGGGMTVEMKGFSYGCVRKKIAEGKWTNWGKIPMLTYDAGNSCEESECVVLCSRDLRKGDTGYDVRTLQAALIGLGYDLGAYGADGKYGAMTANAIRQFGGPGDTCPVDMQRDILNALDTVSSKDSEEKIAPENNFTHVLILTGDESTLRNVQAAYGGTLAAITTDLG